MKKEIILLPEPRNLVFTVGHCRLPEHSFIDLHSPDNQALFPAARLLQHELHKSAGLDWEIAAGTEAPSSRIKLMVVPGSVAHSQGYNLTITPQGIDAVAETPAGIFYAVQTLRQLISHGGAELPALRCRDWPDFPNRGVMLDISRDKVPTMETLYALVDLLASWKINQLQLYTEHTFAYRNHPEVWAEASPVTGEQILALDRFCQERFIELVPNQNTFGHMRPWLIHEHYRGLAECPDGCDTRWGHFDDPFSLNPTDPASLDLVRGLLDELLPHFSSRQVNVGCDETVDLGPGRSRQAIEELGVGRVYFDFVEKIYREVKARGRTMQFWGDIIMEHPELVPELPRDAIALEWGYEAGHPFDQHGAIFSASGVPFYVCPGTSAWNTLAGRTDNAIANLRNAAMNGVLHGAVGYLITDWGDNGHWQPLPVSYLGFAYGAALAWSYQANLDLDIPKALDIYAFQDLQGVMGQIAYDLGNVYQAPGSPMHNGSILFYALQTSTEEMHSYLKDAGDLEDLARRIRAAMQRIDQVMAPLSDAQMQRSDAGLVKREFAWAAEMLRHACRRILWAIQKEGGEELQPLQAQLALEAGGLIAEFQEIWQARNRPGGFKDSLALMEKMRSEYSL